MAVAQYKSCRVCGKEKPFSEFGKNRTCVDGFIGTCKQCVKERKGFRSTAKATCKTCQQVFNPRTRMQVYCSDECRLGDYEKQAIRTIICKNCEKPFHKKHAQKYCSPQCKNEARRKDTRTKKYRPRRNPAPIVDGKRQCINCGEIKPLDQFETVRDNKTASGYITLSRCKPCRISHDKLRRKEYRKSAKGREQKRLQDARRRARQAGFSTAEDYLTDKKAKKAQAEAMRVEYEKARETREKSAVWRRVAPTCYWIGIGRPWGDPKLSEAEKFRIRYRNDPEFKLNVRIRSQRKKQMRGRCGIVSANISQAIKGRLSWDRFKRIVGYEMSELKQHLERQFTKGMSWDNYGEWHIDHIIPKSSFDPDNPEEIKACWALPNLRPLWAKQNISKGAKRVFLL